MSAEIDTHNPNSVRLDEIRDPEKGPRWKQRRLAVDVTHLADENDYDSHVLRD